MSDVVVKIVKPRVVVEIPQPKVSVGIQGVASAGDKHFKHEQVAPSAQWTIQHNLNKHPAVQIVDSGENVVVGEVEYLSLDSVKISFSAPFSGFAYFN